jgi:UDP-N-acetyl-D-glucosamine/UDP-N-acetyl-D-galactosamine dehydrogenase
MSGLRRTEIWPFAIVRELHQYGAQVDIYDPWVNPQEVMHEYGLPVLSELDAIERGWYHAVVAAVGHREFAVVDPREWVAEGGVVYDVKGLYERGVVVGRL